MSKYPFYYFIGEDDLRVILSQDVGEFYEDLMFGKHLSFVDFEDLFGLAISKTNVDSKNKELILRSIHQENKSAFENIILDNGLSVASKYACVCAMCFFLAQGDISNVGFNKMLSVLKDKLSFFLFHHKGYETILKPIFSFIFSTSSSLCNHRS